MLIGGGGIDDEKPFANVVVVPPTKLVTDTGDCCGCFTDVVTATVSVGDGACGDCFNDDDNGEVLVQLGGIFAAAGSGSGFKEPDCWGWVEIGVRCVVIEPFDTYKTEKFIFKLKL